MTVSDSLASWLKRAVRVAIAQVGFGLFRSSRNRWGARRARRAVGLCYLRCSSSGQVEEGRSGLPRNSSMWQRWPALTNSRSPGRPSTSMITPASSLKIGLRYLNYVRQRNNPGRQQRAGDRIPGSLLTQRQVASGLFTG